jgi:hypothetical protein
MNPDLGFAVILGLCALWCAYRMRGHSKPSLPPPTPDDRDSITNFRRMHQP